MDRGNEVVKTEVAASVPRRKRRSKLLRGEALTGWLFVTPWIIGFLAFTLGPMLFSLYASFTEYNMIQAPEWIGARNYQQIFDDRFFWTALGNTFWMVLAKTPLIIILSLFIAVLLNLDLPFTRAFRTIVYLPAVLSGVASVFLWRWIMAPDGLLNQGLAFFGIRGPAWFSDPDWTKPGLIIMGLWWIGVEVIIYLASLKGIDKTLYEAAEIDGASGWAKNWYITIPLLSPTTFFLIITNVIGIFQIFTTVYLITSNPSVQTVGGPASSLLFYVLYLYKRAFGQQVGPGGFQMGYASALAWILFVIILLVTLIQLVLAKRWVYYEADR